MKHLYVVHSAFTSLEKFFFFFSIYIFLYCSVLSFSVSEKSTDNYLHGTIFLSLFFRYAFEVSKILQFVPTSKTLYHLQVFWHFYQRLQEPPLWGLCIHMRCFRGNIICPKVINQDKLPHLHKVSVSYSVFLNQKWRQNRSSALVCVELKTEVSII